MNRKIIGLVLLLLCHSITAQTLYSVILNSPETDAAVVIDSQIYVLSPSGKSSIILQVKAPSERPYFYARLRKNTTEIIDRESFVRAPATNRWTYNEFYNRTRTIQEVTRFGVLDEFTPQFTRAPDDKLHPLGEIATIHITADQKLIDYVHDHYLDDYEVKVNVTHITASAVRHFIDCDFAVSGRTSRFFNKLPYKIKLPAEGYDLNGYRHLRLRTTENDPSYMRDYLTTELLRATNQPGTRASYIRLFLNSRAIGLFTMIEKYDDTWLEREFNPDKNQTYSNGVLYEGNGGKSEENRADLSYKNLEDFEDNGYTIEEDPKDQNGTFVELMNFTAFIRDQAALEQTRNATLEASLIADWEKQIDVEGFLANIALEFLLGSADSHVQNTNNYYLYKDPTQNRFIYIAWDFDYNFCNGPFSMETLLEGDYRKFGWLSVLPLPAALLAIPEYRTMIESQISIMVTKLLDPVISFPVVDSTANLIREDVAWDQTLPRVRKGPSYISGGLRSFLEGKLDSNAILPYSTNILSAIDFIFRINKYIDFELAIEGNTGHRSVLGIKEFIRRKVANYNAQLSS
ncbi:unnamed protein product [Rhizopus stolonifer]